jgi:hypothetical protein
MDREHIKHLIDSLETLKRVSKKAQLTPGDPHSDTPPVGWWIREFQDEEID